MPATEHAFTDPVPAHLYLDTDILIGHLIHTEPHHTRCRTFLERLAREGQTRLYISSLTWMELAQVVTRQRFRDGLTIGLRRRYRLSDWRKREVRQAYLAEVLGDLQALLNQFMWSEISLRHGSNRAVSA